MNEPPKPIRVLIVDDSTVQRMLLVHLIDADPQLRVIGAVADGKSALVFLETAQPDVILMDIHMPGLDGFETTRRIMETKPVPIVICSATANLDDASTAFHIMEAGAVACIAKPVGIAHKDFEFAAAEVRRTVKLMSEVRVVRRWSRNRPVAGQAAPPLLPAASSSPAVRCVGIGASTGGPPVLQSILSGLPANFPAPLLIVQHIASGFLPGLAEWLRQTTAFPVQVASHGIQAQPGQAYLAPDSHHLGLAAGDRLVLSRDEPEGGLRPAVSYLFRSIAAACGPASVGVLLTGMGRDGAAELKLMRDRGAVTIAQNRETSVVHGMPGEAIALGAAAHVLPGDKIAGALISLVNRTNRS